MLSLLEIFSKFWSDKMSRQTGNSTVNHFNWINLEHILKYIQFEFFFIFLFLLSLFKYVYSYIFYSRPLMWNFKSVLSLYKIYTILPYVHYRTNILLETVTLQQYKCLLCIRKFNICVYRFRIFAFSSDFVLNENGWTQKRGKRKEKWSKSSGTTE